MLPTDDKFIFELLNSSDFIKYIGDRNIRTLKDAKLYINKILNNESIEYSVIEKIDSSTPIGILSYIKRDYLDFFDFGFALLPNFYKKGYVTEASIAYLKYFFNNKSNLSIAAISKNKNKPSIKLLERLEFEFSKEIEYEKEIWKVFILKKEKFIS